MTARYIRSTFVQDQREFVQHFQFSKYIGKFLDMRTRPRAQKHTYLALEYEKSGNQVPYISDFEENSKHVHNKPVQIGCDTFPNELVWFHIEAKPIWDKLKKHGKNAVICKMWL